jgi:hypothetical protein
MVIQGDKFRKKQLIEIVFVCENGDVCVQNEGKSDDRWMIDKETFENTYEKVDE